MKPFWDRIRDKIWLRINWYFCDLTHWTETVGEEKDVRFRQMRQDDLDKLFQKFPNELSERKYNILKDRLNDEGKKVFVAETQNDDTPAGYFCTSVTDTYVGEIKKTLTVPVETVYLFDDYVFVQYRGQRIHGKSVCYRIQQYRDLGYKRALVCIDHTNNASFHSYQRCGFKYDHSDIRLIRLGYTFTKTF